MASSERPLHQHNRSICNYTFSKRLVHLTDVFVDCCNIFVWAPTFDAHVSAYSLRRQHHLLLFNHPRQDQSQSPLTPKELHINFAHAWTLQSFVHTVG
jgi:hypothetical protein